MSAWLVRHAAKLLAGAAAVAAIALLLALHGCHRTWATVAQAKLEQAQAGAAAASGADAVATVSAAAAREDAVYQQVEEGRHEITTSAPGDGAAAAERAACGMRSYRDTPRCLALRDAAAGDVGERGAAGAAAGGDQAARRP